MHTFSKKRLVQLQNQIKLKIDWNSRYKKYKNTKMPCILLLRSEKIIRTFPFFLSILFPHETKATQTNPRKTKEEPKE